MTLIIPEVLGVHQERHFRNSFIGDDGVRWSNCPGVVTLGRRLTERHYAPLFKVLGWKINNPNTLCHDCNRIKVKDRNAVGHAQRERLFLAAGGCQWVENGVRCIMRYPDHHRGNFALDHIDPSLKQPKDLLPAWIAGNVDEFWSRVAPNLQVLCQHHNSVKCWQQYGVGGELHVEPWLEDYDQEFMPPTINQLSLFNPNELT
jgi:hypothetical protein